MKPTQSSKGMKRGNLHRRAGRCILVAALIVGVAFAAPFVTPARAQDQTRQEQAAPEALGALSDFATRLAGLLR